jgi:hypothetical protein
MLQLATAACTESSPEPPEPPEPARVVEEAAGRRFREVLLLLIDGKTSEARHAVNEQLAGAERLTPYQQGCIHLTSAWVSQWEQRSDEAAKSFETGLALGDAHPDRPGIMSTRWLLVELYRQGAADPKRWPLRESFGERSFGTRPPELPPSYPQKPDHWPDGIPRPAPIDI